MATPTKVSPSFLILRTSAMCDVPISLDDAIQFGQVDGIDQLLYWCKEQKLPIKIHANGFTNGGDSTDYPCLEICDGRE